MPAPFVVSENGGLGNCSFLCLDHISDVKGTCTRAGTHMGQVVFSPRKAEVQHGGNQAPVLRVQRPYTALQVISNDILLSKNMFTPHSIIFADFLSTSPC
jgi:hypothetical protein